MVQVISRRPKEASFQEKVGASVGQSFAEGVKQIVAGKAEQERKQRFSQALGNISNAFADPNMPDEQKLIYAAQQLPDDPDVVKNLTSALHNLGLDKLKSDEFARKIKQEKDDGAATIQYGQNLREKYPDDPLANMLADLYSNPDMSVETKTKIAKEITKGWDPFQADRQKRLTYDVHRKDLKDKRAALVKQWDMAEDFSLVKGQKTPKELIAEKIEQLDKQADKLRKKYWDVIDEEEEEEEDVFTPPKTEEQATKVVKDLTGAAASEKGGKTLHGTKGLTKELPEHLKGPQKLGQTEEDMPVFDKENPDHVKIAEQLYAKYKDRDKVRKILRRNFRGL